MEQPSKELIQGTMMTRSYMGGQVGTERKGGDLLVCPLLTCSLHYLLQKSQQQLIHVWHFTAYHPVLQGHRLASAFLSDLTVTLYILITQSLTTLQTRTLCPKFVRLPIFAHTALFTVNAFPRYLCLVQLYLLFKALLKEYNISVRSVGYMLYLRPIPLCLEHSLAGR